MRPFTQVLKLTKHIMIHNSKSLKQLDPNYVILINYSKDNSAQILAELSVRGLEAVTRPGPDAKSVFIFTRVGTDKVKNDDIYSLSQDLPFILAQYPLYDRKISKRLNRLYENSIQKSPFSLPTDKELVELALLTGNSNQSLYFAYFKYYIHWLVSLSIVGAFIRVTFRGKSSWEFNSLYTFFLFFWSTAFVSTWIYKSKKHYVSLFEGIYKVTLFHSSNGKEKHADHYKVILKKCCFAPIALLFIILSISIQVISLKFEVLISQLYFGSMKINLLLFFPTLLNYLLTTTLTKIYKTVFIDKFVKWENGSDPNKSIIEKDFIITLFVSYLPLIITLFLYIPYGYVFANDVNQKGSLSYFNIFYVTSTLPDEFFIDIKRFRDQILYYTVTNQIISIGKENFLPLGIHILKNRTNKRTVGKNQGVSQIVYHNVRHYVETHFKEDLYLWDYVNSLQQDNWGPFDYNENMKKLILQFGYISMFSVIWPLTPLISLIFNLIIFKLDLWKSIKKNTPISFPNITETCELEDNFKESKYSSDFWNIIMEIVLIMSSVIAPTLTLMYSNSKLITAKNTNIRLAKNDWDSWYPSKHNWHTILSFGIFLEHLSVLIYYIFCKILISSRETPKDGHVPIVNTTELPQKTNLLEIAIQTNDYMEQIQNELKHEKIKISTISDTSHRGMTSSRKKNISDTEDIFKFIETTPQTSPKKYVQRTSNAHMKSDITPKEMIRSSPKFTKIITNPRIIKTSSVQKGTSNVLEENIDNNIAGATLPKQIPTSKNYHFRNNEGNTDIIPAEINGVNKLHRKLDSSLKDSEKQQTEISVPSKSSRGKQEDVLQNPVKISSRRNTMPPINHKDTDFATKAAATVIKAEREDIPVMPLQLFNENDTQKKDEKIVPLENINNIRRSLSLRRKSIISQKSTKTQQSNPIENDSPPQKIKNDSSTNLHRSSIKQLVKKIKTKL